MSELLTFMMGEFRAEFPADRQYAKNHMWAQRRDDVFRCGFSTYAVRLLQDVYFLDWSVEPGTQLKPRQEIGCIESKKAESSLYAPVPGKLTRFNELLLADPSYINVSPYDEGWLFDIESSDPELLSASHYMRHLDAVWEVAQRTIKGQLN